MSIRSEDAEENLQKEILNQPISLCMLDTKFAGLIELPMVRVKNLKTNKKEKYFQLACNICKKERWLKHGNVKKQKSMLCFSCSCSEKFKDQSKFKRRIGARSHLYRKGYTFNDSGYKIVSLHKNHPRRLMGDKNGRCREHRIVMADSLGRNLEKWEVVHHINGNKQDNRVENLEVLSGGALHRQIEMLIEENRRLREELCLLKSQK